MLCTCVYCVPDSACEPGLLGPASPKDAPAWLASCDADHWGENKGAISRVALPSVLVGYSANLHSANSLHHAGSMESLIGGTLTNSMMVSVLTQQLPHKLHKGQIMTRQGLMQQSVPVIHQSVFWHSYCARSHPTAQLLNTVLCTPALSMVS